MVKHFRLLIAATSIFLLIACEPTQTMKLKLSNRKELMGIPSASGIEKIDDRFWLIGDNSPWIFVLDSTFQSIDRFAIHDTTNLIGEVIVKAEKHDSEAMISFDQNGKKMLLIFGSGSKANRKKAKLVQAENGALVKQYDLTSFYDLVMEAAKLNEDDLNIEAAAVLGNKIYIFNRGKNRMISLKLSKLMDFLDGDREKLNIKSNTIDLPRLKGIQSGFSGATADAEFNRIIFTASVENTSDWVDDGEVLGSYLGVIQISDLHHHYVPHSVLIEDNSGILKVKVESVALTSSTQNEISCVLVTDSDGGSSELLEVEIEL